MNRELLLTAAFVAIGCRTPGPLQLTPNLPKPAGQTKLIDVQKSSGFDPAFRAQHKLGPETTWAGYSKAFSVEMPPELATPEPITSGFSAGNFQTSAGGRVGFLVLDPVDYRYEGRIPRRDLEKERGEVFSRARGGPKEGTIIANGWVAEKGDTLQSRGKTHVNYQFFSEKEYLQVNLVWTQGDAKQEEECRTTMAYGLWSIKVKY